jgi:hypothetical protein
MKISHTANPPRDQIMERASPMSSLAHRSFVSIPVARFVWVTALLGATFLASPLSAAPPSGPAPASQVAAESTDMPKETIDQRISTLHTQLQVTSDQETAWTHVAQTMRENESVMKDLAAERKALDPQSITAVDDLKWYEKFAQAHVKGLRKLIVSFETLYDSMPKAQQSVADNVFKTFGHEGRHSHN